MIVDKSKKKYSNINTKPKIRKKLASSKKYNGSNGHLELDTVETNEMLSDMILEDLQKPTTH
jgi:hypothetical protein